MIPTAPAPSETARRMPHSGLGCAVLVFYCARAHGLQQLLGKEVMHRF
jgi:hypothetical protein